MDNANPGDTSDFKVRISITDGANDTGLWYFENVCYKRQLQEYVIKL